MGTIFTQIIEGRLPARFVWKDDECVVFLSNRPLRPGHCLVVPRSEVDHWIDLEPSLLCHLAETAQAIGRAQMAGFKPERIGVMLAGLEVPHCHFHVVPIRGLHDLDFGNQDPDPDAKMMDEAAATIRRELRKLRYTQVSD
ncbi:MAG: HIT family protein [Chloroflexi bacterium]|nr:MAG: HIT family protein [Chloroflexota bacterium]TMF18812.1 MAG: HIT family protein [Chloroflexota bacterium]TMF30568.1 MAG: HIT family protein [Chloroflexota bacterium]